MLPLKVLEDELKDHSELVDMEVDTLEGSDGNNVLDTTPTVETLDVLDDPWLGVVEPDNRAEVLDSGKIVDELEPEMLEINDLDVSELEAWNNPGDEIVLPVMTAVGYVGEMMLPLSTTEKDFVPFTLEPSVTNELDSL